ncbi:hypothetical protein RHSIM_Rhsim06G0177000 [Rhododendron simsii]|uniref:Nudix hydrolase domain-containing protein n=1 Tax=Rhododendron simsii TaxID=118357 RepID=A0A834LKU7_RHOSS|nr:hypothetical protein RHSIM_Rhsim06G0177000 [Rhododendron simsii]
MSTPTSSLSWDGKEMETESGFEKIQPLDLTEDAYGGVMVDLKESMDSEAFASLIRASIALWIQQGKKGIWIKLAIESVNLVEAAVKLVGIINRKFIFPAVPISQEGFRYHHAEPSYLMLVKWIAETADTLPANASHRVGIGAFVMNDKGEVLVVQENGGKFKGTGVWKLPTGVVDEGEDISVAAIREVKEEAGVETEFVEVLAFRQSHKSFFGKSDLFFVCMLRALSFNIQKQDPEIADAKWMPFDEYAAQPFVQKKEIFKSIADVCLEKKNNNYSGFSALPTTTGFSSLALWLFFSIIYCAQAQEVYGGGNSAPNPCFNGTLWQYSWCHPQPPPPSVYQSYGAPPPPGYLPYGAPPPPPPGFQSYGAPPPAPAAYGGNCPPTVVQCCQYPPPTPYTTLPNNNYSGAQRTPSVIFSFLLFVLVFHV